MQARQAVQPAGCSGPLRRCSYPLAGRIRRWPQGIRRDAKQAKHSNHGPGEPIIWSRQTATVSSSKPLTVASMRSRPIDSAAPVS
jgi:hypothetical protein